MDYFIDTNVALAFSFFPDKFHDSSKEFIINAVEDIYWSENIRAEYDKKFLEVYDNIEQFSNKIIFALENYQGVFINKRSFESFVLRNSTEINIDETKKIRLISIFWDCVIFGFLKEHPEFYNSFIEYSLEVPDTFEANKDFLINRLSFYDCGKDNYKKYSGLLNSLIEIGVHNSDYKIILDAHDFAKDNFTVFVSTDKKFLNKVMNFQGLNVNEYKLLN